MDRDRHVSSYTSQLDPVEERVNVDVASHPQSSWQWQCQQWKTWALTGTPRFVGVTVSLRRVVSAQCVAVREGFAMEGRC